MLYTICIALILIASVLIILAVLVQNPKSGMAANFGASNQVMGVRETTNFLEKFTWTMAIAIVVLSLRASLRRAIRRSRRMPRLFRSRCSTRRRFPRCRRPSFPRSSPLRSLPKLRPSRCGSSLRNSEKRIQNVPLPGRGTFFLSHFADKCLSLFPMQGLPNM